MLKVNGERPPSARAGPVQPKRRILPSPSPNAKSRLASVAPLLLGYLRRRFLSENIEYQQAPVEIPNGWETYTYLFQLKPTNELPERFQRPLVLRVYSSPKCTARLRHEYDIQRHMTERGFPVARPLLIEDSSKLLGGPFLVMEKVAGPTLYERLVHLPWMIWFGARDMAELHHKLHSLSVANFPASRSSFLDRRLAEIAEAIALYKLGGLRAAHAWLVSNRPAEPVRPSILHLDYHPLNLVASRGGLTLLDWTEADIGDYHADVATALILMHCCPPDENGWLERFLTPIGRVLLPLFYRRCYHRRAPLDKVKLAYYKALATLRRLCTYGSWLRAGPGSNGNKPSVLRRVTLDHVRDLQQYFFRQTGVSATMDDVVISHSDHHKDDKLSLNRA